VKTRAHAIKDERITTGSILAQGERMTIGADGFHARGLCATLPPT
jgi:hypothetical protein